MQFDLSVHRWALMYISSQVGSQNQYSPLSSIPLPAVQSKFGIGTPDWCMLRESVPRVCDVSVYKPPSDVLLLLWNEFCSWGSRAEPIANARVCKQTMRHTKRTNTYLSELSPDCGSVLRTDPTSRWVETMQHLEHCQNCVQVAY